jgi:hypothetical protein
MKKTVCCAAALAVLALFTGCINVFHELVPPDANSIESFRVPGQLGPARIGENTIGVTVGPAADIYRLVPAVSVSTKASLLPVTIPYIQKAFPSANVFREAMGFYTTQDRTAYTIDLIKRNPDFTVPALEEAIDFSGPVNFLVVSGLGTIRQYTVTVEVDLGEGKFLSFDFTKFGNADLTRGDAAVSINNADRTVEAAVWYPVENIASFTLVPSFQTNGAVVSLEGTELKSGESGIAFTKPASAGWNSVTEAKTLLVRRPGFDPVSYTLTVTFKEDPDTSRSLTDFRFNDNLNYGVRYTAMGEILDTGDTGTVTVRVHHNGAVPASLTPSFVSPGTVSVEDLVQSSGNSTQDFSQPVYYKVVSQDGQYTRTYRVTVEFVNEADSHPRIQNFIFMTEDNGGLGAASSGMIDHDAGLIVIEAVYANDPPPYNLIPRFSAGGTVSVSGMIQTSGTSVQDFSHKVKYTVKDPGNPTLARDYQVETRFVRESASLAEIGEFRFFAADNPGLVADVTAVIDQGAGTIYAVLPFNNVGNGHRTLYPRWLAQGTVRVGGAVQQSGTSGAVFSPQTVYRVVSADGTFYRDYTVKVLEINTRIYVDRAAAGDNTGVSWAHAFRSLADACDAVDRLPAALAAEVWIAEGTYRPSETRDPAAYFKVSPNTGYYGGFGGTETAKEQRVPADHPVTITGELGGGVLSAHLFMNTAMWQSNVAFGELKFTRAKALTGTDTEKRGPAIYVGNINNLSITGSVFEDLEAEDTGGAVCAYSFSDGSITISGCSFETTSGSSGGAVYTFFYSGSITISGCDFTDTSSLFEGGAVCADPGSGSLSISGCDFETTSSGSNGGAVYANSSSGGSISISGNCTFTNTHATSGAGGAVYANSSGGSITINGGTFANTSSESHGGAVYASSSSGGSITINGGTFTNISSGGSGGAVYTNSSGSVGIADCDFAYTSAGSEGGAVNAFRGSLSISNCTFENTSGSNGGAIVASPSNGGPVSINGCSFENTQTTGSGGAVWAYYSSGGGSITISGNCTFTNTHANSGGAICASPGNGSLSISGGTFANTSSGSYGGGAVYAASSSGGSITISGATFTNTHATGTNAYGGAVYANPGSGSLSISNCNFETTSGSRGGAVYATSSSSGSVTISGGTFTNASSGNHGGAVYATSSSGSITINGNCKFENIQAGGSDKTGYILGGSLSLYGNTIEVTDVEITKSTASSSGGARGGGIYINHGTAALSRVSFTDVKALGDTETIGGAVFFSTGAALTMTDCLINGAVSEKGGGVGGCGPSSCTLSGVAFSNCSANLGSLIFGNKYSDVDGTPAYTVKSGCKVNGAEITIANWSSFMSGVYLGSGATITAAP